ncbi:T9SS type A sorting domain-containing protein [Bacteroidota bacterium]
MSTLNEKKLEDTPILRNLKTAIFKSYFVLVIFLLQALIISFLSADEYDDFNQFCIDNFTAEKEVEMYNMLGNSLEIVDEGDWTHISEKSACICWETNLPAKTKVEYGTNDEYGNSTAYRERNFFLHIHYIKDLIPNTQYHYRFVSVDEKGNELISEDKIFTTNTPENLIRIPDDLTGATPYTLDQSNANYLLTEDITAESTVFNVAETGITLDLGGHTIIYDNVAGSDDPAPPGSEDTWGWFALPGPCGIRTANGKSITIVNGTIRQGEGKGGAINAGYFPLVSRRPRNSEFAGITLDYAGTQINGMYISSAYEGNDIHHNVIIDRGTLLEDRHTGVDGIGIGLSSNITEITNIHHNLIKRTRHRGIRAVSYTGIYSNEIYIDSWATNSYGVMYYSSNADRPVHDINIYDNRIFGTGYHPIGIGAGYYAHDISIYSNYIQMQGQSPSTFRWPPGPGDPPNQLHPVNGFRLQKGPQQNIEFFDNTVVSKARGTIEEEAMMRCLWIIPSGDVENIIFRNNVLKQVSQNEYATGYAVAALGVERDNPNQIITYLDNTIIANTCNIRFGDNYAHGGRHNFKNTKLVKTGNDERYKTIKMGWMGWNYDSYGHTFLDTEFEDGAGFDEIGFEGANSARYDFTVMWTLILRTNPNSDVTIRDINSDIIFEGIVGGSGEMNIPLRQYLCSNSANTYFTAHTVTVIIDGEPITETVVMDTIRVLEIYPVSVEDDKYLYGFNNNCIVFRNHPNPFSEYTIINYELRIPDFVSLKIYDVLGNKITTLINEVLYSGTHSCLFKAGSLSPGVYYYTIRIGERVKSGKLVLVR